MLYKDRDKRSMWWQLMEEALNTSVAEVQRKIHNLRNQISNYFPFCTVVFFVWNGLLICTIHYVRELQSVLPSRFRYDDVTGVSFVFSFICENWIICCISNAAYSYNWSIIFILALYGKVKWPKTKHVVACWVILITIHALRPRVYFLYILNILWNSLFS